MNTIKFNDTTFEIEGYNRNTYFSGGTINSNGNCSLVNANITNVNALSETEITSIQIYHNDTLIYDLQDISARLDSITEYLNNDRIGVSLSFTFNNRENSDI